VSIDSTAEFHDLAYGANDASASIAAMLGAAEAIGRSSDLSSFTSQPMFLFANADEWGLAGSRRFVKDLFAFQCDNAISGNQTRTGLPLCTAPVYPTTLFQDILPTGSVSDITALLGVDQIGESNGQFYVHPIHLDHQITTDIMTNVKVTDGDVAVTISNANTAVTNGALPPTPLTSFVQYSADLNNGAILTGYSDSFLDPRYHTRLDNGSMISSGDVIRLVTIMNSFGCVGQLTFSSSCLME
jgi:Nicastrin